MDTGPARDPMEDSAALTEIARFGALLRGFDVGDTEAETLARITALEELKATVVSVQAEEAVAFETLRVERDRANRVPARDCGVRAGDEVGLAKKVSPGSGRKFLSTSRTVVTGMPNTFKALAAGEISEDKARIMVEETAVLGDADRRRVDTRMKRSLGPAGVRSLRAEARALSAEMDAEAAAMRAAKAAANRRVSLTPIEDGMGRISAILPLPQAVAAFESLRDGAETITAGGGADGRGRQQVMADLFVERLSGQAEAAAVPAEIHLLVEAESLFSDGMVPAWLPGFGPLPAKTAREFVSANEAQMFINRIFTRPEDGQLVGMEARGREFTGRLRQMLVFRDDVCRTPWCDAPIRHADHAESYADGGQTSWENGSGLCAACNYAKEHPGWLHEATAEGLKVTTPSGRTYEVTTPALVRRMRFPRAEAVPRSGNSPPDEADWRLAFSRFLEPEKPGGNGAEGEPVPADGTDPPEPADDADPREVDVGLPFLPITSAEAEKLAGVSGEWWSIDPPAEFAERLPRRHCTRAERDARRRTVIRQMRSEPVRSDSQIERQLVAQIIDRG
ncbi:HNH endonuclease [Brevibacterium oceani]|uniref:HNH endonuclease n=1 Tax=Brevibacterium oceani TaxID=358099 RepID=UPI001B31ECC2|nr:DUF222 domain-containing protein [Brevibacterium oceani]